MDRKKINIGSIIELQDDWQGGYKTVDRKITEVDRDLITPIRYQESLKIKGVEMTNKWAVKFGYSCLDDMTNDFNLKNKYKDEYTVDKIKHLKVHEVQDLFFLMTGNMLKLKHKL